MPDPTNDNDIEALLENLFYMQQDADLRVSKDARRYRSALLALYAQRNELKAQCRKRFHSETIKDLLAERDALKQRITALEAQPPASDLRERLVCAIWPEIMRQWREYKDAIDPRGCARSDALEEAEKMLAAMRKGDTNA